MIHLMSALTVDIPDAIYEVARGQSVTIRCIFKPQKPVNKNIVISWLANADDPNDPEIDILTYYYILSDNGVQSETVDVNDIYSSRITQQQDIAKGVANLTIKGLTANDNRVYECKVKIPGDKDGKQVDTTKLVVLVAPSKPICSIKGTPELFHNITLNCHSEEGTPVPAYKWERYDFTDKLQPNPFRSTDVNGVFSLFNISTDIDGYYICTSKNKIDSASCNMTLAVKQASMNIASTAGIIGACVAALLLLVVIIYCCCRHNKKDQSEEYDMGDADEYTDKEPHQIEERQGKEVENRPDRSNIEPSDHQDDRRDNYDSRQGPPANPRFDYDRHDDRQSDRYDDRRNDRYDDHQSDRYDDHYDDRQSDRYDDRRRDRYDDRRRDYYDDPRDRVDDRRREYYDDPRDRADDRRRDRIDNRFDDRRDRHDYPDDRDRPPSVPVNKPTRA